jgi:hypothetical protein
MAIPALPEKLPTGTLLLLHVVGQKATFLVL